MPLMLTQPYAKNPPPWPVAAVIVGGVLAYVAHAAWRDHRAGQQVDFVSIVVAIVLLIAMMVLAIAVNSPY